MEPCLESRNLSGRKHYRNLFAYSLNARASDIRHWTRRDVRMVDSMIELLFGLSWSALILLIISFIVGSVVAALRAVSHESDHQREQVKEIFAFRDK